MMDTVVRPIIVMIKNSAMAKKDGYLNASVIRKDWSWIDHRTTTVTILDSFRR